MNREKRFLLFAVLLSIFISLNGCNKPPRTTQAPVNDEFNPITEANTDITPVPQGQSEKTDKEGPSSDAPNTTAPDHITISPSPIPVTSSPIPAISSPIPATPGPIPSIPGTENPQDAQTELQEINGLVLVKAVDPNLETELRYATTNNFTKQKVYPYDICVLQKTTVIKLEKANAELMKLGYRLKIWDAYRPISVQRIFWEIMPDSRYVANPDKGGSKHSRGTAVDVTIIDMEGNELEMPSGFDDFSSKAARNSTEMSDSARKNMDLLTNTMIKNGFTTISTEWWHFNDSESDQYKAIDVNLEEFLQGDAPINDSGLVIDPFMEKLDSIGGIGSSQQVLLVVAEGVDTVGAKAYAYEKVNGMWQTALKPMDTVLGSRGLAYDKKEGDKKSPIGVFPLARGFGRVENPGTNLSYTQFVKNDFWVDDIHSAYYNTYQKGPANGRWDSAENLYAIGEVYKYFVAVEYNTNNPIPGAGSAIFMHIWKDKDSPTAGCTAMSEENLLDIIRWLDPAKSPVLAQFPLKDMR